MNNNNAESPVSIHLTRSAAEALALELNDSLFSIAVATITEHMGFSLPTDRPLEETDLENLFQSALQIELGTPRDPITFPDDGKDQTVKAFLILGVEAILNQGGLDPELYKQNSDVLATWAQGTDISVTMKQHIKRFIDQAPVLRAILQMPDGVTSMGQVTQNYLNDLSNGVMEDPNIQMLLAAGEYYQLASTIAVALPSGTGEIQIESQEESQNAVIPLGNQESRVMEPIDFGFIVGAVWAFASDKTMKDVLRFSVSDWNGSHPRSAQNQIDDYNDIEILGG